jgi:hypothetical protein
MSTQRKWTAAGLGLLVAALVAVAASLSFSARSPQPVQAISTIEPGLDFSISSTTSGQDCDSSGTPSATCTFPLSATFTMDFNLNPPLPAPLVGHWQGYDAQLGVEGLTAVGSPVQVWPECGLPAQDFADPQMLFWGCLTGIGGTPSSYMGVLSRIDFQCPSTNTGASLTLIPQFPEAPGDAGTTLIDDTFAKHTEAASESLTIICGSLPSPTPTLTVTPTVTAGGPTSTPSPTSLETVTATSTPTGPAPSNTPLPTNTPGAPTTPPTATRTPTRTPPPADAPGDVNGDGLVNTLDALWVLWLQAGMVPSVARPENADLTHDSLIDARDAAVILQIEAGLVS